MAASRPCILKSNVIWKRTFRVFMMMIDVTVKVRQKNTQLCGTTKIIHHPVQAYLNSPMPNSICQLIVVATTNLSSLTWPRKICRSYMIPCMKNLDSARLTHTTSEVKNGLPLKYYQFASRRAQVRKGSARRVIRLIVNQIQINRRDLTPLCNWVSLRNGKWSQPLNISQRNA